MNINSFTIDAVEVQPLVSSFEIRETVGGVSTLTCDLISSGSPVLRYGVFSVVTVIEDGVTIFAGTITQARERGFGGPILDGSGNPQIVTTVTAEDYSRLADRITVTQNVVAGTLLKTYLTSLVDTYLSTLGVTLDAAQVAGPALPEMSFDAGLASEVLKALADATGYLWRINYDKKLRMWLPGDLAAPFGINQTDSPLRWTGDLEVETILGDTYANRVIVNSVAAAQTGRVETFTGDGTTDTFVLSYTLTADRGYVTHGYMAMVSEPAVKAFAYFQISANFSNGDKVTIDGVTYTFESVNSNTAFKIPIASTPLDSKNRLVFAVMGTGTPGTDYGTGTTPHATCNAFIPAGLGGDPTNSTKVMVVQYKTTGTAGNSIGVSTTASVGVFYTEGGIHVVTLKFGAAAGTYPAYTEVNETLNHLGSPDAATWTFDPALNSITRNTGAPASGDKISITFDGSSQVSATAEDAGEIAAHGVYEHVEKRTDVTTLEAAQALADALLAQLVASGEQTITYTTRKDAPSIRAGQLQNVIVPARNVSGDFIIRDVRIFAEVDPTWVDGWVTREVTAKKEQVLVGKWQQTYHDWLKVGGSAAPSTGAAGPASTGPSLPVTSVQFNRDGAFGGDAGFTYDVTSQTAMIGLDHTPTGNSNLLVGSGHTVR